MDTQSLVITLVGAFGIIMGLLQALQKLMENSFNRRVKQQEKITELTLNVQTLELEKQQKENRIMELEILNKKIIRSGNKLNKRQKLLIDFLRKEGYNIRDIV